MPEPSRFVKSMKDLTDNPGDSDEVLQVFGEVKRRLRRHPDSDRKRFARQTNYLVPELDTFLPDPKLGVPKEVGEIHPLEDFAAMISCKTEDLFEEAIASMFSVFQLLIGASIDGDRFEKATSCIAAVRRACRVNDEEKRFNDLLEEFVASAEGGNKNAKMYLAQVETKASVASALQMLIVLDGDTEQTAPEEVEGMRQRMIAASSVEDNASSKNPDRTHPAVHDEEPKNEEWEDDDLGGMIDDIL
uniref:Ku C-terminal domain-containing protein n=1 Tax=Rhodosorus marinus TaxID=101924 RepID=A0A7S0BJJ5_9RHOD